MEDIHGILKIRVIRGSNLAVRDLFSSDPYVKLRIGEHEVKTRVIKRELNPTWEEELTLATLDPSTPLLLRVMDKDSFTADDEMGDFKIDLRPLIETSELKKSQTYQDGTVIRNIAATAGNGFASDSVIKLKDGNIVQELYVKLQHVEQGKIELELRWQPYSR